MYIYFQQKKKNKKNCDLLPLGSLFLLGLNSAPLSLSFPSQINSGRKEKGGGGATSVDSRLAGELMADLDLSGFSDPRSNGPVLFCFVMSSQKSLVCLPAYQAVVIQQLSIG